MALGAAHLRAERKAPWRRWGVVFLGLLMVLMSDAFWQTRSTQEYFPVFWPIWFGISSVLLVAFAAKPSSTPLYRFSGLFLVTALFSRVGAIYVNLVTGATSLGAWQACIAIITYALAGFGMWRFWIREVGPWHDRYRMGLRSSGD